MPVTDMRRNGFWITLVYRTDRESYAEGIYLCGNPAMVLTKLEYEKYADMSGSERADYAASWRYIHKKGQADN